MPTATGFAFILKGAAAKGMVEAAIADIYKIGKDQLGFEFQKRRLDSRVLAMTKRIRDLRLVKTILQPEKEVDLIRFYQPARLTIRKKRTVVSKLSDIGYDGNIVIQGTAGQGKSIFLRYIASAEFFINKKIPIFIELRRIRQGQSILEAALEELAILGLDLNAEAFTALAAQGKFLLLLDAFDETKDDLKQAVVSEVEQLIRRHEQLRVVITSRPESEIAASALLTVFELSPLEGQEYELVIKKITHSEESADAIIRGVRSEARSLSALLTTPLMVALLVVRYRIDQSIPHHHAAFYDSLFLLLLQRHDKMKGGFVRARKSRLNDTDLQSFFNALCFVTSRANESVFTRRGLAIHAKNALELIGANGDVDSLVSDILGITCLIVSDGDECRFIHKTVQEYYAALFIKEQPDDVAKSFYFRVASKWRMWREELTFLSTIDSYRFDVYFKIPDLRTAMKLSASQPIEDPTDETLAEIYGDGTLVLADDGKNPSFGLQAANRFWCTDLMHGAMDYVNEIFALMAKPPVPFPPEDGELGHRIKTLFGHTGIGNVLKEICRRDYMRLKSELIKTEFSVSRKRALAENLVP